MKSADILILDDEAMIIDSIRDLLELETGYRILTATSPLKALHMLEHTRVQVIVTDFLMPEMNGIDFLVQAKSRIPDITAILITGYADKSNAIRAINEVGIYYYIEKPWDNDALLMIVKNAMERGNLLADIRKKYAQIRDAYIGTIFRLATTSEMFDDDTFSHVLRIARLSRKLAELSGENEEYCFNIQYASMMHDVGKIGVPKEILNKKGKLTKEEFEAVKKHPEIGAHILRKPENSLMQMALDIALCHHEKISGKGYPKGLKNGEIPKAAKIAAITDVFDALLSERPYKPAFAPEKVRAIFMEESGSHFDPELTGLFLDHFDEFLKIYNDTAYIETADLSRLLFDSCSGE